MTPAEAMVVCDASVFIAVAFGEPESVHGRALAGSRQLLASTLLRYEVAQAAVTKCARRPEETALVEEAFARSLHVAVQVVEPSWPEVIDLARKYGLSAYDASYLQVAQALGVPLATLDERLARAAESLGLLATS